MNTQKVLVLIAGVVVIAGTIFFQTRRPAAPAVARSQTAPAVEVSPTVGSASDRARETAREGPTPSEPAAPTSIPTAGWGRNPFLTSKEAADLNAPPRPPQVVEAVPPPPPALPQHKVTAIIWNPEEARAVVDSRVVRVGDRLGQETVKQIKQEAVILEHGGETREIGLNRPAPYTIPQGE